MSIEQTLNHYSSLSAGLAGESLPWLQAMRQEALALFADRGFPTLRDEDWRYTKLSVLDKTRFETVPQALADPDLLSAYQLEEAYHLVMLNGHFSPELSDGLPASVNGSSLRQALLQQPDQVAEYLGKALPASEHGLITFNNAWFNDGIWLEVGKSQVLDKPIQILHLVTSAQALAATRNIFILHPHAQVEIIETYVGAASFSLTVSINECFLGADAELKLAKLQAEPEKAVHFGGSYVKQARSSRFKHQNFAFGAQIARTDIHTDLFQAAECQLDGLYVAGQRQHLDTLTRINHLQAHGISREFYKGVLDDNARGVFQGRVVVAQDAQKTDSEMNNRNLLLSANAEIDSKPQLEIYADDVKCSHGMTVGQLDEKSMFYLQSRAIDQEAARDLLTFAFANEMVEKVEHTGFKALLHQQLLQRFPAIHL
jgi:Fe-S cluster assembly protein SufD